LKTRSASVAALCAAFFLLGAAEASAAVRFAAPGGIAPAGSPCLRTNPCSLFNAAHAFVPNSALEQGDEIVVEPGNYSDTAGDLGPERGIIPEFNTTIHGVAGRPRPVITIGEFDGNSTGFFMNNRATLRYLEIISVADRSAFLARLSSTVDRVIARGSGDFAPCAADGAAVISDTACLSTGDGPALEMDQAFSNFTLTLRNVTATATAAGAHALEIRQTQPIVATVDAISLIARAPAEDVFAQPLSGSTVNVNLDNSDFADVGSATDGGGGNATITAPGDGTNITDPPLLAADGYHELPGSKTIDAGATDASSGTTDIDGNQRVIGTADIGADEHGTATTTALSCAPASLLALAGSIGSTTCTAKVSTTAGAPSGSVALASDGPGSFAAEGTCALVAAGATESGCQLAYAPSAIGTGRHNLSAFYAGDAVHEPSEASARVQVGPAPPPGPPRPRPVPNTRLKKKPAHRTSSRLAAFSFVADQPNVHFQCKLDKPAFKPCRSPFKRRVKPGRHSFQVRAVDSAGKADLTPANYRWLVSAPERLSRF
jgi:hypothetical protein